MNTKAFFIWLVAVLLLAGCTSNPTTRSSPPELTPGFVKQSDESDRIIVFVHGIFGDQKNTWINSATGANWPEMITKDPAFRGFDVYTVDFESPIFGRASNIPEIASRVRDQLARRGVFDYREVYFITHSMGGLITKRMLIGMNTPSRDRELRRVKAVLFFGTPSHGAPIATIGNWLSRNPQLRDMKPSDVNSFIQDLEWQWEGLLRERETLKTAFPQAYCAYEKMALGVTIVNSLYATSRCDNQPYPIDLNHLQIVKPASLSADVHDWARARIKEAANRVTAGEASAEIGFAHGFIRGRLDRFYRYHKRYPNTLDELGAEAQLRVVGRTRTQYRTDPQLGYVLRFSGLDRQLNTPDDRVFDAKTPGPGF